MFVLTDANAATCALVLNLIELNSLLIFHYSVIDRFKLCLANGHHQTWWWWQATRAMVREATDGILFQGAGA